MQLFFSVIWGIILFLIFSKCYRVSPHSDYFCNLPSCWQLGVFLLSTVYIVGVVQWPLTIVEILFYSSLLLLLMTDLRAYEMPWTVAGLLILSSFLLALQSGHCGELVLGISLILGGIHFCLWGLKQLYQRPILGDGDLILILGLGLHSGAWVLAKTLYWAILMGGGLGLLLILLKKKSRKDYLPFAPFMIAAYLGLGG